MPFDVFHEGVQALLGRPVWSHEFADVATLRAEHEKLIAPVTTFAEVFAKLQAEMPDKEIIVVEVQR
jgi:hypothetical protein